MTGPTDHNPVKYVCCQRRPKSGSRHSLCRHIQHCQALVLGRLLPRNGLLSLGVGRPHVQRILSSDGKHSSFSYTGTVHKIAGSKEPTNQQHLFYKSVSLRPLRNSNANHGQYNDLDEFSTSWSMRYAVIQDRTQTLDLWSSRVKRWILGSVNMRMSQATTLCRWLEHSPQTRIREWENYLLLALQYSHGCALKVLDAAISHPSLRVPKHTVDDSLDHLTRIYLEKVESPSSFIIDTIYRITCNLAKRSRLEDGQTSFIPKNTVYWVLYHCHNVQAISLYNVLHEQKIHIRPSTLLCFLARFIEMGKIPLSLDVLRKMAASGLPLKSEAHQSKCNWLLRALIKSEDENCDSKDLYKMQKHTVAQILQMGIRPDMTAYTVIIQNAVEAKEYQSAVQFYQLAREIGLKPNGFTYIVLLEAAMQNLDYHILDMVVHDAETDCTLYGDESLIFKLLLAELKLRETTADLFLFDAMLRTYKRYCDPRLVQDLGLCEPDVNPPEPPIHPLFSPSPRMLSLMLVIYIRQNRYSDEVLNLYQRYHRFVEERHPTIAAIEETNHVANAFIFAFGQRKETLQMGIKVVRKMMENAAHSSTADLTTSVPFNFAGPTVHTWSILAMVHSKHGQHKAVEKILGMMRERGLKPNHVTWNGLISGYSALQRIDEAVTTVKRMERAGFPMNSNTLKGLGRFSNRDRLLKVLKEGLGMDDDKHPDEHADKGPRARAHRESWS